MANWSGRIPWLTTVGTAALFAASLGWVAGRLPAADPAAAAPQMVVADGVGLVGVNAGATGGTDGIQTEYPQSTVQLQWLFVGEGDDGYWLGVPMGTELNRSAAKSAANSAAKPAAKLAPVRTKTRGS